VAEQQRLELVADLAADRPEAAAQEVLEVGLEDEHVGLDAVELELFHEHAPHLPGRAADEGDAAVAAVGGVEEGAQEGLGADDGDLVLGLLPEGFDEVLDGVEVGLQVGLVEVPAQVHEARRAGRLVVGHAGSCAAGRACSGPATAQLGDAGGDGLQDLQAVDLGAEADRVDEGAAARVGLGDDDGAVEAEEGGAAVVLPVGELADRGDAVAEHLHAEAPLEPLRGPFNQRPRRSRRRPRGCAAGRRR
jgi:hypothetical protein